MNVQDEEIPSIIIDNPIKCLRRWFDSSIQGAKANSNIIMAEEG
jgi:hypothetical protein